MSDKAKNQAIEDFQNKDDVKVIVLNIVAGGVGVTLTAAHNMIINDIPWTTGELEQAEGRIWRSGQKHTSMIYYMVADRCKMDDILQDVITQKSMTINTAIDGGLGDEIDFRKIVVR
jgi:SNF2 family DNA or RNA helicase